MSLWIVVGGQFGSEGKGKVAAHITLGIENNIKICVRCGGPNSGHSFILDNGNRLLLRQLSVGVVNKSTRLLIPAGAVINPVLLQNEIKAFGLDESRVGIDTNAMIMEECDLDYEKQLSLGSRISSTLSGTGSAVARRVMRTNVKLANQYSLTERWMRPFLTGVLNECLNALQKNEGVLIEGTQGYGLSLYHSPFYPKCTSRDTLPSGALSEVGLSPMWVKEIVCVLRTFPIRVHGLQAGPLKDEIDWETVAKESGNDKLTPEITSVTSKERRVARFDWEMTVDALRYIGPTRIAIMGMDYLDYNDYRKRNYKDLGDKSKQFLNKLSSLGNINYIGTGPKLTDMIGGMK